MAWLLPSCRKVLNQNKKMPIKIKSIRIEKNKKSFPSSGSNLGKVATMEKLMAI